MIYHSSDAMDGWCALAISILKCVPPDQALKWFETGKKPSRKWTDRDIKNVTALRGKGLKWQEIADMYGVAASTLMHVYRYRTRQG